MGGLPPEVGQEEKGRGGDSKPWPGRKQHRSAIRRQKAHEDRDGKCDHRVLDLEAYPDGAANREPPTLVPGAQQAREEQVANVKKVYDRAKVKAEVAPFFGDMGQRLGAAHLVIARAGASTVTELEVAGRPAILIPFAAAADDHQTANAEDMTAVGAADVFSEAEFEPGVLAATLERRLSDPHGLAVRAAAPLSPSTYT